MSSIDQAIQTQLGNIQKKTGKSLTELVAFVKNSGLSKHGELRAMAMRDLGLGYGDANLLIHTVQQGEDRRGEGDVLDGIYSGAKATLRPIHEAVMERIDGFGEFEIAPKKNYLSLRRRKQFAMLGPVTNTRLELGLNVKDLPPAERLLPQPRGSICNYIVKLTDISQVNAELVTWLRFAYESAG